MVQSATIRPIDTSRAARVVLAFLDTDIPRANNVLRDAEHEDAAHLLVAALAAFVIQGSRAPAMTDEQLSQALNDTVLVARTQAEQEHGDD